MKIATYFKRPNTPIDIEGTQYFFRPIDPANPDSPHVCEVANGRHAQRFLGITEGYYIPDDDVPAPVASRPTPTPTPAPAASTETPPAVDGVGQQQASTDAAAAGAATSDASGGAATDDTADEGDAEEINLAARTLIEPHWQKVLSLVKGGGIPRPVLQEALRLEQAKAGDDEPRQSVVKALQAALAT